MNTFWLIGLAITSIGYMGLVLCVLACVVMSRGDQ